MGYLSRKWSSKEFTKKEGYIFVGMTGNTISEESELTNIKVLEDDSKNLIIYGEYEIQDNSSRLNCFEMIKEMEDYYTGLIRGKEIDYVKFDDKGNLEISISTENSIKIILKAEGNVYGEIWQYNFNGSYIVF